MVLDQITARFVESPGRTAACRLDAYRIDGDYFIDIALPGVDPASIDVTVEDENLTVRASRGTAGDRVITRRLTADQLDTDRLEARYDQGVLTLRIPITRWSDATN
jgi:HSP20 family protein